MWCLIISLIYTPVPFQDKKAAKERERDERIAEAEAENIHSARNVEAEKLKKLLDEKCLKIKEVNIVWKRVRKLLVSRLFLDFARKHLKSEFSNILLLCKWKWSSQLWSNF